MSVVVSNGNRRHSKDGVMHRDDGPAYEDRNGTLAWYVWGLRHREDGPAVIWANGDREWWLNGVQVDAIEHFLLTGPDQ